MERNLMYDTERLKRAMGAAIHELEPVQSPEVTFERKMGTCVDAAVFAKHSLLRVNQDYNPKILFLSFKPANHYVCVFYNDGNMYVMDYGLPQKFEYKMLEGIHGPFKDEDAYKSFFSKNFPRKIEIKYTMYGFPSHRSSENDRW
jgi:hypothetical protein